MLILAFAFIALGVAPSEAALADGPVTASVNDEWGKMPLYFIANEGQMDERVAYYVQGSDKTLYFASDGVTFALNEHRKTTDTPQTPGEPTIDDTAARRWIVKLDFLDANQARPSGQAQTEAVISYFKGSQEDWRAGLPTYSKIVYRELWEGIDLTYSGTVNLLKHEFIVQPGADPARIRLAYRGASVRVNAAGQLDVSTPAGGFQDDAPIAYQEVNGQRVPVAVSFALDEAQGAYGFHLGAYDPALALVIDPAMLVYCGFIGGSGGDHGFGIAVDAAGNAYVTGYTASSEATFPVTVGPDLTYNNGDFDAFVAKVNADGTALVYAGYIGGSGYEYGYGIAVDAAGNAYVTGDTMSTEATFPVTGGPDLTHNGDPDVFVAKVNAGGTALVYAGYIGGNFDDHGRGIVVDAAGNAYVTGQTASTEATFPVIVGPDLTHNGIRDAFVAKVNAGGTALVYAGYIGGSRYDYGSGIAVDAAGNAYVTGSTESTEATFPVTVGPDLTSNGGLRDAFVAKVNAGGTALVYAGYIGGSGYDYGYGIAVDAAGNAYVTGSTESTETTFPVTVGPDLTYNGISDAFVAKVNADGTALVYAGYIGGSRGDFGYGIAVDAAGNAYVAGNTTSTETTFPVTIGPDLTHNGGYDAFVAKVNAGGTTLVYAGYIGGSGSDNGNDIAVDAAGNAYITGYTYSTEATFPVTGGPDLTSNGGWDAFVAKVSEDNTPPTVLSHTLQAAYAGSGPSSFTVTFSEDVGVAGGAAGANSATNPANYRIINRGANGSLETASCSAALGGDDAQIIPVSVTYTPNTSVVNLGSALPAGSYRLFVCGTTSIVDLAGNVLAGDGLNSGTDFPFDFTVQAVAAPATLPDTGFPQGQITRLPAQPAEKAYAQSDLWLEIPKLGVKTDIVGVPQVDGDWDVTWLGSQAGWLEGSAFPTWAGNTVLTGHVWDANNNPGVFVNLKTLQYGDKILIHAWGQVYTYEVRESRRVNASNVSSVMKPEKLDWLTLVTCEDYRVFWNTYSARRMVRAVLVSIK